ncbi:MAG: DUF1850 domain-containing protein [Bacteroides sp.]|nr:DUF1850 domain-containing protein [Prevotella sp.]MCM1406966.1 DUF1850 domain-containing protein [Treponema brennaborense]MCM1470117.1 DUF1850 domain-containing protein [Bacteroides sp.]
MYIPCRDDREFVISYTHSVNRGRVYDFYTTGKDGGLCITKSRFVSYGAGMPEPADYPGQQFVSCGDYLEMRNINRTMPELLLAVGVVAAHVFETGGRQYVLTDYFKPQTSLIIRFERVSLFSMMKFKGKC